MTEAQRREFNQAVADLGCMIVDHVGVEASEFFLGVMDGLRGETPDLYQIDDGFDALAADENDRCAAGLLAVWKVLGELPRIEG